MSLYELHQKKARLRALYLEADALADKLQKAHLEKGRLEDELKAAGRKDLIREAFWEGLEGKGIKYLDEDGVERNL